MSERVSPQFTLSIDMRVPHTQLPSQTNEEPNTVDECNDVTPVLLPIPSNQNGCECLNCGEPWNNGESWTQRTIKKQSTAVSQSIGDLYRFECPECEEETFERISDVTDT